MWIAFKYFLRWVGSRVAEQEPLRLHGQLDAGRKGDPADRTKWGENTIKHEKTSKIWFLLIHNYVQTSMQEQILFVGLVTLIKTLECHLLFGSRTSRRASKKESYKHRKFHDELCFGQTYEVAKLKWETRLSNPFLEKSHTTFLIVAVLPKVCESNVFVISWLFLASMPYGKLLTVVWRSWEIGSCNFHLWLIFGKPSPSLLASSRFWPNLIDWWGKF